MAKRAKAQKPVSSAEDDVDRYNKVVDSADISSIQMVHIDFDVEPRYFLRNEASRSIGYEVETKDPYYDVEDGFAACMVSFRVESKDSEGPTLGCKATYAISYHLSHQCDEAAVAKFLKRVGVFACYPYFRSLFASLDWSAGTRLPPLPVHKENMATRPKKKPLKKVASEAEAVSVSE